MVGLSPTSLRYLTESDITAMVRYLRTVTGYMQRRICPSPRPDPPPRRTRKAVPAMSPRSARACKFRAPLRGLPMLEPASVPDPLFDTHPARAPVNDPPAINVVQVILIRRALQTDRLLARHAGLRSPIPTRKSRALANYVTARFRRAAVGAHGGEHSRASRARLISPELKPEIGFAPDRLAELRDSSVALGRAAATIAESMLFARVSTPRPPFLRAHFASSVEIAVVAGSCTASPSQASTPGGQPRLGPNRSAKFVIAHSRCPRSERPDPQLARGASQRVQRRDQSLPAASLQDGHVGVRIDRVERLRNPWSAPA